MSYFKNIAETGSSVLEGMAITFSHLFRKPVTIQYPDKIARPLAETLPDRFRGFLKVDMEICTACLACMTDCPIDCIKIVTKKATSPPKAGVEGEAQFARTGKAGSSLESGEILHSPETPSKGIGSGLARPIPQPRGFGGGSPQSGSPDRSCDASPSQERVLTQFDIDLAKCMYCGLCTEPCPTGAIHFTREFERATENMEDLVFKFVPEGEVIVPYKAPKKEAE